MFSEFTIVSCRKAIASGFDPSDLIAWGARRCIVRRAFAKAIIETLMDTLSYEDQKTIDWVRVRKNAEHDFDLLYR